jgi:hypothetical protein|tara:strand:- start:254 stop:415 length:162 start_codon:yes stop_codon:yes gene_type:complete
MELIVVHVDVFDDPTLDRGSLERAVANLSLCLAQAGEHHALAARQTVSEVRQQ